MLKNMMPNSGYLFMTSLFHHIYICFSFYFIMTCLLYYYDIHTYIHDYKYLAAHWNHVISQY